MTTQLSKATSGTCYICHRTCDAPRVTVWDSVLNEKIKLCSQACLNKYQAFEQALKDAKDRIKSKYLVKKVVELTIEDV